MIPVALSQLPELRHVSGDPSVVVAGLAVDSRLVEPRSLFVAIRGRVHDGHNFASAACRAGAVAVACAPGRARPLVGASVFEADPLTALAAVARGVRARSAASVIAVAGSAGKTSTKDILAALCSPHRRTVASVESFNNEIGLPLTLGRVEPQTELIVCELGTGRTGEIAALARVARPHVAVITAIAPEHLESLGSLEGVAAAEAELIESLRAGATVVLPFAEPLLDPHRRDDLHELTFGLDSRAEVHPVSCERGEITLSVFGRRIAFHTDLRAPYQRLNLCAAVAAYVAVGLPLEGVALGAPEIAFSRWRGQERPRRDGGLVVNDAYNANPLSMRAAIEALAARRNGTRVVAVLGEMSELGPGAPDWHARVGAAAAEAGIDVVVGIGPLARHYLEAAASAECHWFADLGQARTGLPSLLRAGDVILLKGSRAAGLEALEEAIV